MLDKTIPYYDIIMSASMEDACFHPIVELPNGFIYKMYQDGDEQHWAELETSVQEFENKEEALSYFNRVFMPYKDTLPSRMCFILDADGNYVATASAWFKTDNIRRYAVLHWVSTSPKTQGFGLGKAIVIYALSKFPALEQEKEIFLHTQTWSYIAVGLYGKLGFKISTKALDTSKTDPKAYAVLKEYMRADLYQKII